MNSFYKNLIEKTEAKKEKDEDKSKRVSKLLEIKDERTIPKLRTKFTKRGRRRWTK